MNQNVPLGQATGQTRDPPLEEQVRYNSGDDMEKWTQRKLRDTRGKYWKKFQDGSGPWYSLNVTRCCGHHENVSDRFHGEQVRRGYLSDNHVHNSRMEERWE